MCKNLKLFIFIIKGNIRIERVRQLLSEKNKYSLKCVKSFIFFYYF